MFRLGVASLALAMVLAAAPVSAGTWQDAEAAYRSGDYRTAAKLYRVLAEQGLPKAQYAMGQCYYYAAGVPKDYAEAAKWFSNAAAQGFGSAQFALGVMYYKGEGVQQDSAEALRLFREAAAQEVADAQNNLGVIYVEGRSVPQDFVTAYAWFSLAAAQGNALAKHNRDSVEKDMTPAQVTAAQKLVREWADKKRQK